MLWLLCRCEIFGESPTVTETDKNEKEVSTLPLQESPLFCFCYLRLFLRIDIKFDDIIVTLGLWCTFFCQSVQ